MAKPRGKTAQILQNLTPAENDILGLEVERLIKEEMSFIVNRYMMQYKRAVFETFGWDHDDLMQFIRVTLWKGAATFEKGKKIKITTYLSTCLKYQFYNLSKKCKTKKHSMSKLYCPGELFDTETIIQHETPEYWLNYIQSFESVVPHLNHKEKKVLARHIALNQSMKEISLELSIKKSDVVKIVKIIKVKMKLHLGVADNEKDMD